MKYEKFGESNFKSREMSEAFDVLEKAMLVNRVYASASKQLPLMGNLKKAPKLLHLDVGLVNYQLGIRAELAAADNINAVYHGQISEQVTGQMLLARKVRKNVNLHYWYRDHKAATSEVDYLTVINNKLIPLEVKSGKTGTLRSLHNFMDESECRFAVRVYSGNMKTEEILTPKNKKFILYSLPFYLLFRLEELLQASGDTGSQKIT